jgi:transcriptional regulator of acetoin/glycerol metabolism
MSKTDPKTLIIKRPTEGGCAGGLWALRFVHSPDAAMIGKEVSLTEPLVFGRVKAGVSAPNWHPIADRRISGEHVAFEPLVGGRLQLKDLESSNGTFVNGARAQTAELVQGDVVKLGSTLAVVTCRADGGKVPAFWADRVPGWVPSASYRAMLKAIEALDKTMPIVAVGEVGCGKKALLRLLAYARFEWAHPKITMVDAASVDDRMLASVLSGLTEEVLILEGIERLPAASQKVWVKALAAKKGRAMGALFATTYTPLEQSGLDAALVQALKGVVVVVPPLRQRREEILSLAQTLLPHALGLAEAPTADDRAMFDLGGAEALLLHDWPDNVRGLERCIGGLAARQQRPFTGPAVRDELGLTTRITAGNRKKTGPAPRPMVSDKLRPRPSHAGLKAAIAAHGHDLDLVAKALGVDKAQIMRWLKDDDAG